LAVVCLMMVMTIMTLLRQKKEQAAAATATETERMAEPTESWWSRVWKKLEDAVPVAEEASIDMGHEYDGIRELDNNLPPWWKYGFYVTIGVAIIYMGVYHIFGDWSSDQEYQAEMAEAAIIEERYLQKVANMVNENTAVALTDAHDIANGANTFKTFCETCHGDAGQGGIGPNLADQYWLHGGDVKDLFKTVKYGVPEKGMISWKEQLDPRQIQEVVSFILTFQGTDPPNPKKAEGELYTPVADTTSVASAEGLSIND
ncbi:MAG: cbb3-type cytochrome c oxidase N-terminal domain-containing protein, partial [Bacteroidota bacterium]